MTRRALFLDRDGVLNREVGYISRPEQLILMPGVAAALRSARTAGFKIVVVTNQSAVARGLVSEDGLEEIHRHLRALLAAEDASIDALFYCPHHPDASDARYRLDCPCRKPRPGLFHAAAAKTGIDLGSSVMVGDTLRDTEAARAAGLRAAYLVLTGHGVAEQRRLSGAGRENAEHPDAIFPDLAEAVARMLATANPPPSAADVK